jgi:hypothetical protein
MLLAHRRCAGFTRLLHMLDAFGKLDSDEADLVRDMMDGLWHSLTGAEQARIEKLSERIYKDKEKGATMLDLFNPLKWVGFHLACLEVGLAILGSLARTYLGED